MNEAEWLACADPDPMLTFLRGKASERKLRLFACACCRSVWGILSPPNDKTRQAVEVAERYADELANDQELDQACVDAFEVFEGLMAGITAATHSAAAAVNVAYPDSGLAASGSAECVAMALAQRSDGCSHHALPTLSRDIIGNPFRPSPPLTAAVLAWNDRTVPRLAHAIYEERKMPEGTFDPARLAILADALLDAGCDDEDLIQHCRSEGPHVRGCWAVDLCLGKS
jgi:hypothetical protein